MRIWKHASLHSRTLRPSLVHMIEPEPEEPQIQISTDEIVAVFRLDYPDELAAVTAKIIRGRHATAEALDKALRPKAAPAKRAVKKSSRTGGNGK